MALEKQNSDGSMSIVRERDVREIARLGGVASPAAASGTSGANTPSYMNGSTLCFNLQGGVDTGGGILSWLNNLGYDIIVSWHSINVTTVAAAACTVKAGGGVATGTTASTNMIASQDVHTATGAFGTTSPVAVLVPANTYITISTNTGASAGLVGIAYFVFMPVQP